MNKHTILTILTLLALGFAGCERDSEEPITPSFSVAEGRQVIFSKGNLQFSTAGSHVTIEGDTVEGTFRFAEQQYDYIGQGNAQVSSTYTGWIDLLCWGSSGWHVSPSSEKDGDYDIESLCGDEAYADWGVYNAIQGDDQAGLWRTLTRDEWDYLINLRPASTVDGVDSARYAEATVAGALHIRLGGMNSYFGKESFRAYMGDPIQVTGPKHIMECIRMMYTATVLYLIGFYLVFKCLGHSLY